jgi:DNA-binding transcriptional ArsR family regulator
VRSSGNSRVRLRDSRSEVRRPASGSGPAFAAIFAALGDRTRLRLVERLSARPAGDQAARGGGDRVDDRGGNRIGVRVDARVDDGAMSITKLTAEFNVSRQAITKHLRVMERAGLVSSSRRGRERLWQLRQRRLDEARDYLEQISKQWDEALGRLRVFVES